MEDRSSVVNTIGKHKIHVEEARALSAFFKSKPFEKFVSMLEDRIGMLSLEMLSPQKCPTMDKIESIRGEARGIKFVVDLAETVVSFVDNDVPLDTNDEQESVSE